MPHLRSRFAQKSLQKKLKFSRIVSIQGARQTGKSVLARDLFEEGFYLTLDLSKNRKALEERPETFLAGLLEKRGGALSEHSTVRTIVIDEAQKVPLLFDEIKAIVDQDSTPGQFLLLGSTEFSHETKIRESLTGRLSRIRLYPMLLSETLHRPLSNFEFKENSFQRKDLLLYLEKGGFPGQFAIRDNEERRSKIEEWINLTCERDILQIKRYSPDPDLCARILETLPHLEEPTSANLSAKLNKNPLRIKSQLKVLKLIFAIHEIKPHFLGSGKSLFYLIDPSHVEFFKGSFERQLETAALTELLGRKDYSQGTPKVGLSFYRTAKGGKVDFILEHSQTEVTAIKLSSFESLDRRELLGLDSFKKKFKSTNTTCKTLLFYGGNMRMTENKHEILRWETLF